jgi:glycosyltransferase involved in cell wall biosynthesis
VRASVIVPTYDHGELIAFAVESALAQTETDLEVIVVGDGVPDAARPGIERVVASDARVRFLDRPKAPGHGFRLRDEAIRKAKGDAILYLADDDIWFPEHVELMCAALEKKAEFVAGLPLSVTGDAVRLKTPHDLGDRRWRRLVLDERSMISMTAIGHTRELYSRLDPGWARDDADYKAVWRDFARNTKRTATLQRVTAAVLPAAQRTEMSTTLRHAELKALSEVVATPEGRLALLERLLEHELGRWSELALELDELRAWAKRAKQKGVTAEPPPKKAPPKRPRKARPRPGTRGG